MTDAHTAAAELHRQADAIGAELLREWRPAARRAIYARSAMLRAEARELVSLAQAAQEYGPRQSARRELDRAFARLS